MKAKNQVIWGDEATLRKYKEEFDFIGRECEIQVDDDGALKLVVFALPQKKPKAKPVRRKRAPRG